MNSSRATSYVRTARTLSVGLLAIVILSAGLNSRAKAEPVVGATPPAVCCMGFAYMPPPIDKVIMYGGLDITGAVSDETWAWDQVNGWQLLIADSLPGPRSSTRMVYDPAIKRIVLFGGKKCQTCGPVNAQTWTFTGNYWARCTTCTTAPPARISESMEFTAGDPANPMVVMFGGMASGGAFLGDTWLLKGNPPVWTACSVAQCPVGTPSGRISPTIAYDGSNQRLLMFGGQDAGGALGDTWFFDSRLTPAWSQCPLTQCPVDAPLRRFGHRMVYDQSRGQIFLFGAGEPQLLNDAWFWSGTPGGWAQCGEGNGCPTGTLAPAPRCCVGLAYDTSLGKVLLFGGGYDAAPSAYGDTWTWDPVSGWQCVSTACSS